jgi:putative endonuclease
MFYVYVLKSKKKLDQLYIGYTTNLKERLKKHNEGLVQSTKPYLPWKLIFYEAYQSKKDAKRREQYFKTTKGRKALKLMLKDSLRI